MNKTIHDELHEITDVIKDLNETSGGSRLTEKIACPICGSDSGRTLYYTFDKLSKSGNRTYPLIKCKGCGLVYLNPRPRLEDRAELYNPDYLFNPGRKPLSIENFQTFINWLAKKEPGTLLDIGTGNSPFLPFMQEQGWQVQGTELNQALVAWFFKKYGISLALGELEDLELEQKSFDGITTSGVLEHIPYPRRFLEEVHRLLKDDGFFCLSCFNRSIEAALLGKYWMGFDAPRHLFSFSISTLTKLMEATGFNIEEICYSKSGSLGHTVAWSMARARSRLKKIDERHDYLLDLPRSIKIMNKSIGGILSRLGKSGSLKLYATKI